MQKFLCIDISTNKLHYYKKYKTIFSYEILTPGFYLLNKSDIFTGCYFHTVKILE